MIKTLRGKTPVIHPDAFVSEFAYVVGDVTIGARSSVWPGVVIRGESPIVIGEGTCVQDNSTIHSDANGARIGDNVLIGHNVLCHAASVGDGAVLGNGCTVSNDAEVGGRALIAAGAVVLDNAKIPEGMIAQGVPAKPVREVTPELAQRFRTKVLHYQDLAREYKAAGGFED